jgi:group II intron reverse transcriptase/maturase
MIPKSNGSQRPLGTPTVKGRVVQTALSLLLMPIWEADFHPLSYGFRPERRAHQAVDEVHRAAQQGYVEIIDADLSRNFDMIPHRELIEQVARLVSDGSALRLIKGWLRAPIVEEERDGKRRVLPNLRGTPQGGVISPLLANLYLNSQDYGPNQKCAGQARMVRYPDDFVISCRPGQAQRVLDRTKRWLTTKGLKLDEAKTRVVDIRHTGTNFLGFGLTWRQSRQGRGHLHVDPNTKSRTAIRQALRGILNHWTLGRPIGEMVTETNRTLRGWAGYLQFRTSKAVTSDLRRYNEDRLRRWLWRKYGWTQGLWKGYPSERLHNHYERYAQPIIAAWKAVR